MKLDSGTASDFCLRAQTAYRKGLTADALANFHRALALDPSSSPARFGLASLHLDCGDIAGATAQATQMAKQSANQPEGLWLHARLAMARDEPQTARNAITQLLKDPRLDRAQRAEAFLLLGLALGDLGLNADAFSAARDGKQLHRAIFSAQAASSEDEIAKLRRLGTWIRDVPYHPPLLLPLSFPEAAAQTHVFLLGFPRSGTTLLEQVLAEHPRVDTLEEAPTLATAYQAFLSDADACASLSRLGADEAEAWVSHYWSTVRDLGINPTGRVFIDKQPAGTLYLPIIARLFPHAKILFALRDPRDVVLSCFRQAFQMNAMTYSFTDLADTASCYDACMILAEHGRSRLPLAWTNVHHEALVEDFDTELIRILDFLALGSDPAMGNFAHTTRAIRTPSAVQVRAGLNRRGLGRWQHFSQELMPIMPLLAPWVERFGYAG